MSDDELKRLLDTVRKENSAAHEDTRNHFDASVERVEKKVEGVAELRHYFDIVTEGTKHEVRLLAESVAHGNEELQRTRTALDEKIERTARETQAMIKFSHTELDRSVNALDENRRRPSNARPAARIRNTLNPIYDLRMLIDELTRDTGLGSLIINLRSSQIMNLGPSSGFATFSPLRREEGSR